MLVKNHSIVQLRLHLIFVLQECMPVFIWSVYSGCNFVFVQVESLLPFGFGHWFVHYWLVRIPNVVFRWLLSLLNLFQVFVTWIGIEMMRILRSWLEAEPLVIVEVRFSYCLKSHHEFLPCWLIASLLLRQVQSLGLNLLFEVKMLQCFPPIMSLPYSQRSASGCFLWF